MKLLSKVKSVDILTWLCFFSLVICSNYFLLNIGQSDRTLPFNSASLFSASLIIVTALWIIRCRKVIMIPYFVKLSTMSVLVMILPLLFMKSDVIYFIPRLVMLLFCLVYFLSLYQFKVNLKHVLITIFLGGVVQAIWGGIQHFHLGQTPYGIFQQVNVYGSFMAMSLAVSGFLASRKLPKTLAALVLLYPIVAIFLLFYTESRTAVIGAVLSTVLLLPLLWRYQKSFVVKGWLFAMILGWCVVLVPNYFQVTNPVSTPIQVDLMEKSGREYIYPQVLKLASENLWTGVGFEKFTGAYIKATGFWYKEGIFENPGLHNLEHPHSEVLFWLIEGGIVSLTGLLFFIGLILYRIWKTPLGFRLAFLSLITPIALHVVLEYPIYHSFIHLFVLLLLLFVIDKYSRGKVACQSMSFNYSILIAQVCILGLSLVFVANVAYANVLMKDFIYNKETDPAKLEFLHDNWLLGTRYNIFYQERFIKNAINKRSEKMVREYIEWAEDENIRRPFVANYRYLIFSYTALGELEKAEEVKTEADELFPKFEIKRRNFNVPKVIKGT